ncbi:hypothetical protein OPV22_024072 [Ensete ventricosum]|uniref:START domain-containing protein n=1 Tax=Ensete ventricosum TaxID=4639 RepID=A0AAV8QPZ0_ENSVE|nr:hypothetical protein OPV22_024072 [Ensete ventricosum]
MLASSERPSSRRDLLTPTRESVIAPSVGSNTGGGVRLTEHFHDACLGSDRGWMVTHVDRILTDNLTIRDFVEVPSRSRSWEDIKPFSVPVAPFLALLEFVFLKWIIDHNTSLSPLAR